jgi:hypothetical protein
MKDNGKKFEEINCDECGAQGQFWLDEEGFRLCQRCKKNAEDGSKVR